MAKSGHRYLSFFVLFLVLGLMPNIHAHAQQTDTSEEHIAKLMAAQNNELFADFYKSIDSVLKLDSATVFAQLSKLEKKFDNGNMYFKARFKCYVAWAKTRVTTHYSVAEVTDLTTQAMNYAFNTSDNDFIASISWLCGSVMFFIPQLEAAVTFRLKLED